MSRHAVVLGAGGFLGSHLTRHLIRCGWTVSGVVAEPRSAHVRRRLSPVLDDVELVIGDATDPDLLKSLVVDADAIFPFAGRSGAARSMNTPLEDLAANGAGQLTLLEALRQHNPDARVVFPGSRLQYGRVQQLPVSEEHPQQPLSIYGVHKMLADHYHRLYADAHGIATCRLRISNPYGPAQDRPDKAFGVVGTFFAAAARGADIELYGGGRQLRDYVYVDDLVDVFLRAATSPAAAGQVFNVGGPKPTTLREMAETVVSTVGRGRVVDIAWPSADEAVETGDYIGDIRRAEAMLGWRPRTSLADGLAATWAELSQARNPTP